MAIARLIAVVFVACAFSFACGTSPCGLKLQQHLFLPRPATIGDQPQQKDVEMPCCGASVFQDIDLRNVGDVEIDLSNPNGNGVDGFVTSAACDKLFSGPYTGVATSPTCQVYIGPVPPRAVSERKKIAPGRYRLFAQGYTSNENSLFVSLDLGVWSNACKWSPIAP